MSYSVSLVGPAPWGFRLQGGKDFCLPLTISRLTDGGKAAQANISVGDVVLSIDGIATDSMNHLEAQNKIKACTDNLNLTLQRPSSIPKDTVPKEEEEAETNEPQKVSKTPPPVKPRRKPTVEPEVTHASPVSDASKKRLIEDTEDWHPRTGTSQSRSFRILAQLTGTENEQAGTENSAKKVNKLDPEVIGTKYNKLRDWHHGVSAQVLNVNEVVEDATPGAHVSAPAKTFSRGPGAPRNGNGVPPPSWQPGGPAGQGFPKGGALPSFGKVSSVPKGPDRPTPQPHPQDLSLVQRAEHIPAGTRTPMCSKCNNVIRGPFLVAMGMAWHPEEFNCSHCHSSLVDCGFVEEKGQVYCEHCYEKYLAPTCASCQQKVLGEVMNALKQTWHVYCFVCVSCQQPIRGNTFHMEDGQPYCERDYYSLFGTSCHGCDFPIEAGDKFLEALGFTWHDTCFVCAVCSASLEGQAFFSKKDKPLCKKHAHTVKI